MVSPSRGPVSVALRLVALLMVLGANTAAAGEDPDAAAFDADANMLGAGLARGLAAAWAACGGGGGAGGAGNASSVACQGLRLVRSALSRWAADAERRVVELSNGVELVALDGASAPPPPGRASRKLTPPADAAHAGEEAGLWGRVRAFLQSHELRIRLPQLLPRGSDSWAAYLGALHRQQLAPDAGQSAARKKDKGGGALLAMMGMMGGMMMMMGMAGVGALAMKALGVASMALMMAIAAALKKLASKDDGGGHHVVAVHAGHGHDHGHRRRRDAGDPNGDAAHRWAYAAYVTR